MNYSNFDQVLQDLQSINQAIEAIRQRIVTVSGVSYASQDARHVALDGLQCDIGACGNWIRVLMSLKGLAQEKYGNNWDEEYRNLIGTGLTSSQAEELMLDYLRNTLISKVHFKIENLFNNILKALSASPKRRGFWHTSSTMLQQADIPPRGREKDILTVLANLRNSFHANGMHNNDSLCVDIDGIRFEFCKGKRVECASWKHIVVIIRANISVLESVLFSDRVASLKSQIPDAFAAGNP
ncbi:hypothetical protein VJY32_14285 [Ignavibacteria bacterium 4148-Me]|uniref:hypothetical protein n=1 Tax=Rosettibacter primus TaxID=3111523 RepID=UPI00336BD0EE